MIKTHEILDQYASEKMYWSALLLGEYLYNQDELDKTLIIVVESMFNLGFYEKCVDTIENNVRLQRYYEISKIYLKSVSHALLRSNNKIQIDPCLKLGSENNIVENNKRFTLNPLSILKLYESLCNDNSKDLLIESFLTDTYNFEAIFILNQNNILAINEIKNLLLKVQEKTFFNCLNQILFEKDYLKHVFSPTSFLKIAKDLYILRDDMELFSLGVYMVRLYRNSEYSYFILGMYYLLKNNYEESKKCFYKSLKIKKGFGYGWIGLGISYSGLKECINALECFTNSQRLMLGSSVPPMYLGFEYHKMNNLDQAELWYKNSLTIEKNSIIVQRYSDFLISNERYNEALELLEYENNALEDAYLRNTCILNFLRCFCHLFTGNIPDAMKYLKKTQADWRYFITRGFIKHIQNQIEEATYDYHEALIRIRQKSVIEDLLSHAVDIMSQKEENCAFNYASDLFEALDLKSIDINFI